MMAEVLEDLIMTKAAAMADHDGTPISILYILAAANLLQTELLQARDNLLKAPTVASSATILPDHLVDALLNNMPSGEFRIQAVDADAVERLLADQPAPVSDDAPTAVEPAPAPTEEASEGTEQDSPV